MQDADPAGAGAPARPGLLARLLAWLRPAKPAEPRRRSAPTTTVASEPAEGTGGPASQLASRPGDGPVTDIGQRQLWKEARSALGDVLDRHASARHVFRHLGALEHAVAKHGSRALRQMPIEVLEQALSQLESMVSDWSAPGLAFLRSTLAVEVKERLKVRLDKEHTLSVFVAPNKLQVDEDSESAFMEFQRHWAAANASAEAPAGGHGRRAA